MDDDQLLAGHVQEIRRGSVVLACLAVLERPHYGYSLLSMLETAGFGVDANTLYPLLRRLEKQGLLTSKWNTDEVRPRKYYQTSERGRHVRDALAAEWAALNTHVTDLLGGSD